MIRNTSSDISAKWQSLRTDAVQGAVWLALARRYEERSLRWQARYAARQAVRCDLTLRAQVEASNLDAGHDAAAGDALLGRAVLPEAAALAARFSAAVTGDPDDWLTWLYLTRLHEMQGDADSHQRALEQARAQEVIPGESLHWLGVWRLNAGDAQGAVNALSGLVDLRPLRHGSMMYLGEALLRVGNVAAAEKAFTRASLSPNPDFLLNLATRVYAHNYLQDQDDCDLQGRLESVFHHRADREYLHRHPGGRCQ